MIKEKKDLVKTTVSNLRGGIGDLGREDVFKPEDACDKLNMCAIITIPDGCTIGEHTHGPDAEIYYILTGTLRVTDNGVTKDLLPGDAVFTGGGNAHCVENVSGKDASMLAIVIK